MNSTLYFLMLFLKECLFADPTFKSCPECLRRQLRGYCGVGIVLINIVQCLFDRAPALQNVSSGQHPCVDFRVRLFPELTVFVRTFGLCINTLL